MILFTVDERTKTHTRAMNSSSIFVLFLFLTNSLWRLEILIPSDCTKFNLICFYSKLCSFGARCVPNTPSAAVQLRMRPTVCTFAYGVTAAGRTETIESYSKQNWLSVTRYAVGFGLVRWPRTVTRGCASRTLLSYQTTHTPMRFHQALGHNEWMRTPIKNSKYVHLTFTVFFIFPLKCHID